MNDTVSVIAALEALEKAAQGNDRLDTLKRVDGVSLRHILYNTLSPDITFGIKKIPEIKDNPKHSQYFTDEEWYLGICSLLSELKWRRLTGNDASDAVYQFLASCNDTQYKWATRIIRQDLRLNLGAKDVNNALGENTIYLFSVPLATDYKKVKEKDLKGCWFLQPKMDGGRCVAILYPDGNVELKSRTGKEWRNFESVKAELVKINSALKPSSPLYIDGEVVSRLNGKIDFQAIQKTMMRKDGKEVGELQFVIFDAAEEGEWKNPKKTYLERLDTAFLIPTYRGSEKVVLIQSQRMTNPTIKDLEKISQEYVEMGFEGAMARRSDIPVQNKRSKTLLKIKTFIDDEAEVIGASELQREGKGAGVLGAIKCRLKSGVEFEIGSGFTAEEREGLWKLNQIFNDMPKYVNFKYFRLTDDGKPFLPVFRYFRSEDEVDFGIERD